MDLELAGKRAIVTGGSRGIGKAIVRQLAIEGTDVGIAARDEQRIGEATTELSALTGRRVVGRSCDTGDDKSVRAMVAFLSDALGGVDILVNAAAMPGGVTAPPKLADVTTDALWAEVNVKVMGYLRCAREVAPLMVAQGWGRIINVSGLAARSIGIGPRLDPQCLRGGDDEEPRRRVGTPRDQRHGRAPRRHAHGAHDR